MRRGRRSSFSALQRAENSSNKRARILISAIFDRFSALQRAENSSIDEGRKFKVFRREVSVLFSEPKIPQCSTGSRFPTVTVGFSALQRAENSSIQLRQIRQQRAAKFQCSSASRKFLNKKKRAPHLVRSAEFQCSSASRKFLNASV